VPSWKRRRGKVLLGPNSENGDPRRGGSKVADGRSAGAAKEEGATGSVVTAVL